MNRVATSEKTSREPGRHQAVSGDELLDRFAYLRSFFEDNWGRIGLELQHLRSPEELVAILKPIPGVESEMPFRSPRGHLRHILLDEQEKASATKISLTRRRCQEATNRADTLWTEFIPLYQKADETKNALLSLIGEFKDGIEFFPFFLTVLIAAAPLGAPELNAKMTDARLAHQRAKDEEKALAQTLCAQIAWYVRNEVFRFIKSERYEMNPDNFASATAGLPDMGWFTSIRRTRPILDQAEKRPSYPYQLFEVVQEITCKTKTDPSDFEKRLQKILLSPNTDPALFSYVSPNWRYMKQAIHECPRVNRRIVAYKIIKLFLDKVIESRSVFEAEMAKREELLPISVLKP